MNDSGALASKPNVAGRDPVVRKVVRLAERLAATEHPIHFEGEPGTGRENLARFVHARGPRAASPFSVVEIGDTARGATPERFIQEIEAPCGGTLFVSCCEMLEAAAAARLVGELQRPDSPRLMMSSARGEGGMPALVRLVEPVTLCLPPLRARRGDIGELVRTFLGAEFRRDGVEPSISRAALLCMWRYDWPGNVAELREETLAALARAPDGLIRPVHLSSRIRPRPLPVESTHPRSIAEVCLGSGRDDAIER